MIFFALLLALAHAGAGTRIVMDADGAALRRGSDQAIDRVIVGVVRGEDARGIARARVALDATTRFVVSDSSGAFSIRAPEGALVLEVRRLGFLVRRVSLGATDGSTDAPVIIVLVAAPEQLAGLLIPGSVGERMSLTTARSTIDQVPALGEPDAFRTLRYLPGIGQPNDYIGRVHLAGSALDESLVTLDGHPLQGAMHLSGVFGGVSVAALERVEVLMHHVPATTDTRAGGVIALSTREAGSSATGEVTITPLSAGLTALVPHSVGDLTALVSVRATYIDQLLRRVAPSSLEGDAAVIPEFRDVVVRLSPRMGTWRLDALGFWSEDLRPQLAASPRRPQRIQSEIMGGLTAQRRSSRSWTVLRASADAFVRRDDVAAIAERRMVNLDQRLWTASVEHGFQDLAGVRLSTRLAFTTREHEQSWEGFRSISSVGVPNRYRGAQSFRTVTGAVSADGQATKELSWRLGTATHVVAGRAYFAPRAHVSWATTPSVLLNASLERRLQFDGEYGAPRGSDFASPLFLFQRPRILDALTTGGEWRAVLPRGGVLTLRADVFLRGVAGRPAGVPRSVLADTVLHRTLEFRRVSARTTGVSLGSTVAGANGLAAQVAYTFSNTIERDTGVWTRAGWDRPHMLNILGNVPVSRKWALSTSFRWQSGLPFVPLRGILPVPLVSIPDGLIGAKPLPGRANAARLPSSVRLDLSLRRNWTRGRYSGYFSVQLWNALNEESAIEAEWFVLGPAARLPQIRTTSLPRIPSIGLGLQW